MSSIDALVDGAGPALGRPIGEDAIPESLRGVFPLLARRNGFYAYHSALLIRGVGPSVPMDVAAWNAPELWTRLFGAQADDLVFFAEDIFGGQFGVDRSGSIWTFDPETAERARFAGDADEFASRVLREADVLTGYVLAREWQLRHGALRPERRLIPHQPFVLGGSYSVDNLKEVDAALGMRARAGLASELRALPDGTRVRLKVKG